MNDWYVNIPNSIPDWWSTYPLFTSGNILVPAEVGEVLVTVGVATHWSTAEGRSSHYWKSLPWNPIV